MRILPLAAVLIGLAGCSPPGTGAQTQTTSADAAAGSKVVAPPPGQARLGDSVSDTRWRGVARWDDGASYDTTMHFRPDGVLVYGYNGNVYDNGRWTQNGQLLFFDTNDHYALYVGRLNDAGTVYEGEAYNRTGARGTFSFRRD